jgi:hypothetical protein
VLAGQLPVEELTERLARKIGLEPAARRLGRS